MKKVSLFFSSLVIILFITACAQKVNIKALEPAQVDRVADTKKISVTNFDNDRVGLSRKIESNLASFQIDDKKYFTMVSRNDFDKIIQEQKIQNSGLIDQDTVVEVGQLIGAQAIISGHVSSPTLQDSYYYEKRSKCADKKCKELIYYKVRCIQRVIGLSAEVKIVDIQKGDVIFADTLSRTSTHRHCSDDSRPLLSREMGAQRLSQTIANSFTYRLTPHYRHFRVTLLEDPDLEYNDRQELLLESSLEYIEQGRNDKAQKLLIDLINSTDSQSYVAFYNLGVIKEAQGNYKEAKEYYSYADNLMVEPIQEINAAVIRINRLITKREKSRQQIQR